MLVLVLPSLFSTSFAQSISSRIILGDGEKKGELMM